MKASEGEGLVMHRKLKGDTYLANTTERMEFLGIINDGPKIFNQQANYGVAMICMVLESLVSY